MKLTPDFDVPPNCGKRLLPAVLDETAANEPTRIFVSVPKSSDISEGFRDIDYGTQESKPKTILYFGPLDIRYLLVLLGAAKAGHIGFLSSHRNSIEAHQSIAEKAECETVLVPDDAPAMLSQILQARSMKQIPTPADVGDSRNWGFRFFDTAWHGALPIATQGPDNTAGSTRTFNYSTAVGNYTITEALTAYLVADDGSVKILYEQAAPVKYKSGKGEFAGYWVTFQFDATLPTQSAMGWISYSCQTEYPFDLAEYRTAAINNATSILKEAGKQPGKLLGPLSETSF